MNQILKPILVVLGSPARENGFKETKTRFRSKRPTIRGGAESVSTIVKKERVTMHIEEWRAARRIVTNALRLISSVWHTTPLGHIALESDEKTLSDIREICFAEAIEHNRVNRHWQVLVELCWSPVGDDARNMLLTLTGDDLPERFWIHE